MRAPVLDGGDDCKLPLCEGLGCEAITRVNKAPPVVVGQKPLVEACLVADDDHAAQDEAPNCDEVANVDLRNTVPRIARGDEVGIRIEARLGVRGMEDEECCQCREAER